VKSQIPATKNLRASLAKSREDYFPYIKMIGLRFNRQTLAKKAIVPLVMPDLIRHPGQKDHLITLDSGSSPE
jgi:hypothetical protein